MGDWTVGEGGRKEINIVRKENIEGEDRVGEALQRGRIRRITDLGYM